MRRLVTVLLGTLGFLLFLHAVEADAQDAAASFQPSAVTYSSVLSLQKMFHGLH